MNQSKTETITPEKTIVSAANVKETPENIKDISKDELKQKIQSDEEFIAYYYQPTCHFCKKAAPDINGMSKKHDRTIYRIDISTPEIKVPFKSSTFQVLQLL